MKELKVFIVTISAEITTKDIQDYIWMNVDGEFTLNVTEVSGAEALQDKK